MRLIFPDDEKGSQSALERSLVSTVGSYGDSLGQRECSGAIAQYRAFVGTIYTAVSAISKRACKQPLYVSRIPQAGSRKQPNIDALEPIEGHFLLDWFSEPNGYLSGSQLLRVYFESLLLTGRATLWVREKAIDYLPSHWVFPGHTKENLFAYFDFQPPGFAEPIPIPAEEIAHCYLPDPANPLAPLSPVSAISRSVNIERALQLAQESGYSNGMMPSWGVKLAKMDDTNRRPELSPQQRRQIEGVLGQKHEGAHHNRKTFILDGLIDELIRLTTTPQEMDFIESGKWTREQIFQAFSVNPIIVGEIQGANRASAAVADQAFVDMAVNPLLTMVGECLTNQVAKLADPRLVLWFELAVANDAELKLKRWDMLAKNRCVTINEIRKAVGNLPAVDWGEVPPEAGAGGLEGLIGGSGE
ncbi:phage portal protein [Bremerella sp. JC770]|uniref:phage portal protein n=1 Tax=Bremerella sp. JC770 TaxID=3232137 RepID=UPI0034595AE2